MKLSTGFIHMCMKAVGLAQDYARFLTASLSSTRGSEPVSRIARSRCLMIWAVLCVIGITPAYATKDVKQITSIDSLKLYAHSRIINYKEFQCFNKIITKESRWNYLARNKSHYGLGQMRSKYYGTLDPYSQIDATIKYINGRYGSMCAAWEHHKKGWY